MTQIEKIKEILANNEWVCGTEFMKEYIPEYRSRINEIRKRGFIVEAQKCKIHSHRGNLQMWRWLPESRITQESANNMDEFIQEIRQVVDNRPLHPQGTLLI